MGIIGDMILKSGRGISLEHSGQDQVTVNGVTIHLTDQNAARDEQGYILAENEHFLVGYNPETGGAFSSMKKAK